MQGKEIKKRIVAAKVKVWEVAEKFGVADTTFSKRLRRDFSEEETAKILRIIDELKEVS